MTEIFVLVTYGTFTSQGKNHSRRACYGMLEMLFIWGFLILFGTLVLRGKTLRGTGLLQRKSLVIPTTRHISYSEPVSFF